MSESSTAIVLKDESNPLAIVNLVPKAVAQAISDAMFERPELFEMDEHRLFRHLRKENNQPTPTDNRLRLKFWTEYDRVAGAGEARIKMDAVLSNLVHSKYFYEKYLGNPTKVAWLMCPPVGYMMKAEEALEFGLEQLRDILEQEHVGGNGKVDTKLGELKAKIVAMLDSRVKGAVVQRSMNVNVNTSDKAVAKAVTAQSMEEIERKLKELRRRDNLSKNISPPPPDIEVEAE